MRLAHTVEQVRSAEAELLAEVPPGTLMQRAAAGLAVAISNFLGGNTYGARVVLLIGSGDNGGDALYAGQRLARRGAQVTAVLLSEKAHAEGLAALGAVGGRIGSTADIPAADLVVDGIVGIGGRPGLRPDALEAVRLAAQYDVPIVAVDIPSGVDVDTGETPAEHVKAALTVTFGTHKPCHFIAPAATACGPVHLVDIGLTLPGQPSDHEETRSTCPQEPRAERGAVAGVRAAGEAGVERDAGGQAGGEAVAGAGGGGGAVARAAVVVLQAADVRELYPVPDATSDKYSRGVLGLIAGSAQYPGAAVIAAAGALAGPLGMVRYIGPDAVAAEVRAAHPEIVAGEGRVQAWAVGSGLGDELDVPRIRELLTADEPVVLDADGIRALDESGESDGVVITPHAGELARLLGVTRAEVEARRLHHARAAAERYGVTVLLKGSTTLIAAPDGRLRANTNSSPWLATAGSGDVLTGLTGALLSGGLTPFDAASVAAYLHASAAQLASTHGPITALTIAHSLPEATTLTLT